MYSFKSIIPSCIHNNKTLKCFHIEFIIFVAYMPVNDIYFSSIFCKTNIKSSVINYDINYSSEAFINWFKNDKNLS